jgi:hypothetical protein
MSDICNASGQNINNVTGSIFKMKDGRWRMRIPKNNLDGVDMSKPYSGTLDRKQYNLYSMLADFGIDYNTIDEKYYQYNIEVEGDNLYCYAYTENCVRGGMFHYIKNLCSNLNKITLTKSIQYHIYRDNEVMKTEGEGNDLDPNIGSIDILFPQFDY